MMVGALCAAGDCMQVDSCMHLPHETLERSEEARM